MSETCWAHIQPAKRTPPNISRNKSSNTQRTENKTTDVVIHQQSRKLLKMDILMSETCWAHNKWNKIASDIKLVFHSSAYQFLCLSLTVFPAQRSVCNGSPKWSWQWNLRRTVIRTQLRSAIALSVVPTMFSYKTLLSKLLFEYVVCTNVTLIRG